MKLEFSLIGNGPDTNNYSSSKIFVLFDITYSQYIHPDSYGEVPVQVKPGIAGSC